MTKMAAWEFCLQDGGVSEFYPQDGGVGDLPTRWRQCAFLRVLPTRWRRGRFAYKMAAFMSLTHKMAA